MPRRKRRKSVPKVSAEPDEDKNLILLLSGFSKCKQAEDAVVDIVDQCKPERKCGGAGTKEEAEKQLKILTP